MPDDLQNLIYRFANIELEIAALRKLNKQLAVENARLAQENAYYTSGNHCPLWPYEIVKMVQEEFPGTAPMFFDNCIKALKQRITELENKYEPDSTKTI